MAWQEKIVSLETQLKELHLTVAKYENWFQDQKLFCECVAKYFLRQFGFDIWLQLDMLKSALGLDSSDSEEGSLFLTASSRRKRPARAEHWETSRLIRDFDGLRERESYGSARLFPPPLSKRVSTSVEAPCKRVPVAAAVGQDVLRINTPRRPVASSSYLPVDVPDGPTRPNLTKRKVEESFSVGSQTEKSPEVTEVIPDDTTSPAVKTSNSETVSRCSEGSAGSSRSHEFIAPKDYSVEGNDEDCFGRHVVKSESSDDYCEEIPSESERYNPFSVHLSAPLGFGPPPEVSQRSSRGPSKRHSVWAYYEVCGNRAKCLVNGCSVEVKGVFTTNAMNHLKRHHPHVYNEVAQEEWMRKVAANRADTDDHRDGVEHLGLSFDDPLA